MAEKKRILLFIDWYLPGYKAGGPIQSCANLVAHLQSSYQFFIVTRDTDYCENIPYSTVKSDSWNLINENVHVYYFSKDGLNRKNIFKLLSETPFDYVYLNGIFSFYFTIIPLLYFRKKKTKNIVLAARGMLAPGALEIKGRKKNIFLFIAQALKLYKGLVFHATGADEKKDIESIFGKNTAIKIAGNLPKIATKVGFSERFKTKSQLQLVNIARIAPEKNLLYALEILKQVKQEIVFDFYGPVYDSTYFELCTSFISTLPPHIHATYKGVIPNVSVAQKLNDYHALFMPTLGENFGHIILESLQASCPVIISDQTPWRNLEQSKAGWDIALKDKSKFIETIEMLADTHQETYNLWSKGAYTMAEHFTENKTLLEDNYNLFNAP